MAITKTQREVLDKMDTRQEYSAYTLQCSLATLNSLVNQGLLSSTYELGSLAFSRTSIKFKRI